MNALLAHAGHPHATANAVEHGAAHWVIIVPVTIAVLIVVYGMFWMLSNRSETAKQESKDEE